MKTKLNGHLITASIFFITLTFVLTSCDTNSAKDAIYVNSKEGIHFFSGTLDSAMIISKAEHKPLFIMVHASWCSVCTKMKKEVLPKKEIGDLYNSNFLNVLVDYDSKEGKLLQNKYEIEGTPTFIYLSAGEDLLNKISGFQEVDDLIYAAKKLKVAGKAVCN